MGSYKNNFPVDYATFGKSMIEQKENKTKSTVNYLGKEKRFFEVGAK